MHVLIANDDGVFASGIRALAQAAAERGHRVSVFAPDTQRSAASHALTMTRALHAQRVEFGGIKAYAVDGTPADCVRLGIHLLGSDRPDFVLSGVNRGANRGAAILYSGTVAAAMEASLCGIPAAAVSLCSRSDGPYETAAKLGVDTMEWAIAHPLQRGEIYNLNVPRGEVKAVRAASVSNEFICSAFYTPSEDGGYLLADSPDELPETDSASDLHLTRSGYASLSILTWNLQSNAPLPELFGLGGRG